MKESDDTNKTVWYTIVKSSVMLDAEDTHPQGFDNTQIH